MQNFEGFGLSDALNASLANMNYTTPTPIQAQAIPLALQGHDIMGTAQTGTGKTAAFAIPLIERLLTNPEGSALVLTPTRELGKQIMDIMHQLLGDTRDIKTAFIIGGEQMIKQFKQLDKNPRLIVGTPGRINDHLLRGSLKLDDTDFLVLDETDRMLDMGFTVQLERIFKFMPAKRQTLMFSATLPKNILQMSKNYMSNPQRVSVGEVNVVAKNIKQEVIRIEQGDKYVELKNQLDERVGSVIVFVKTKYNADKMAVNLRRDGYTSEALHGDLRQSKRAKVMKNFHDMNFRVLIATDIAARGLDVPHIQHVVNYDLPQVAEDFIHRMGRTARAGADGEAISFVSNQDGRKWHAIEQLLNPDAKNDNRFEDGRKGKKNSKSRRGRGRDRNDGQQPKSRKRDNERSFEGKKFADKKRRDKPRSNDNDRAQESDNRRQNPRFKKRDSDNNAENFENKKRNDKPRNDRSYDDKPRNAKPRSDDRNQQGNDKPRRGKPMAQKPRNGDKFEASENKARRDDKPRSNDKSFSKGKSSDDNQTRGDKPRSRNNGKTFEGKKRNDRNDKSRATFKGKPSGNKSRQQKPGKSFSRNKAA